MSFADKTLTCRDCRDSFVFTTGEQEFYAEKGFTKRRQRPLVVLQRRLLE